MRRRSRRTARAEPPTLADPVLEECRSFVRSLNLPRVKSVREMRGFIEELISEPIIITPGKTTGGSTPCGMVIKSGGINYIGYDPDTSPAHQDFIIGHEYGHLLKGHRGIATAVTPDNGIILGDIETDLWATVLGRTNYSETIEREAEGIGSFLQAHVITSRPAPQSESADRITRTLMRRDD
ncbi:ImmA/IrrE family metallo-endopeptidase [Streptomyces sp. NBC_01433]|uniref:ImmA/IrrE family metallo-endopeptidase n=1 Tax=Streptomyces sp. NBC_01433 TaxID=2903864 RepID=UPI002251C61D|nr:ImmA/IrrE family metallo-endopeptidase [Streptomyces sp. NBC_01433]MCX4677690.1 ImmA/IrrE family metallo-endopeptidase [Streptomyces sp. NBC_01433]